MILLKDGILLFSQIFHDESVVQLKCHTQFPSQIRSLIEQVRVFICPLDLFTEDSN